MTASFKLAKEFLELPYHIQVTIANKLKVPYDIGANNFTQELPKIVFQYCNKIGIVDDLRKETEKAYKTWKINLN